MQNNKTGSQPANEQIMTLNFLVMKHICETLLPANPLSAEVAGLRLKDALGFEPNAEEYDEYDENDEKELFIRCFLKAVGYKTEETDMSDGLAAELELPNPLMSDVIDKLKAWWSEYSASCKANSIVHSQIDPIFVNYGHKSVGNGSAFDCRFEHFDKLMTILSGYSFDSVYNKIKENPFVDFVAPGKRLNTYSVSVSIFKRETYCGISDYTSPAKGFDLPMRLVTASPAVVGKNLMRLIGLTANSLVEGGFAGSHCVSHLTICKNGQDFLKIPVDYVMNIEAADDVEAAYLQTNLEWEKFYELDFKTLKVIRSNKPLLKSISDAMPEKDRYGFLAAHFAQDLGL